MGSLETLPDTLGDLPGVPGDAPRDPWGPPRDLLEAFLSPLLLEETSGRGFFLILRALRVAKMTQGLSEKQVLREVGNQGISWFYMDLGFRGVPGDPPGDPWGPPGDLLEAPSSRPPWEGSAKKRSPQCQYLKMEGLCELLLKTQAGLWIHNTDWPD